MKLAFAQESAYTRKFRILLREKRLTSYVQEVAVVMKGEREGVPVAPPENQLVSFIDDKGGAWTDAHAIYGLMDAVGPEPLMVPADEAQRNAALRLDLIADGAIDVVRQLRAMEQSPESEDRTYWVERFRKTLAQAVDAAEAMNPKPTPVNVGVISMACFLTWLDRKVPDLAWKKGHPKLVALQTAMESRDSFKDVPPA